ncbi:MAG: amidohydrolase [Muribaculaceae bacterium]|nr:amidohydrolase [Muribaculaceae bacterium]
MAEKTLLLKNIWLKGKTTDILIRGNRFASIGAQTATEADEVIDCTGKSIFPAFYNAHTHAAMTILRGYGDDMPLYKWLTEYIWPYEATLTAEDIRQASLLAGLEMIKSGTVFFNDMYWQIEQTLDVAAQMGLRAAIGLTMMDNLGAEVIENNFKFAETWSDPTNGRLQLAIAPHAIYTVSRQLFTRCAEVARANGMKLHFHIAETELEVANCVKEHGTTPIRLLRDWGVLGSNCIAAHVVHADEDEMKILADYGVTVAHNPCSNMKLNSGIFNTPKMIEAGVNIALGTDGASSNDSLSMLEEMKFASLLAKMQYGCDCITKYQVLDWASLNSAKAFDIDAGVIAEGRLADAVIADMDDVSLLPCHSMMANWLYSADTRCINMVICDGRILMRDGRVNGEEEIIANFKRHFAARKH